MRHLTVRNVPAQLSDALEEEKSRLGISLNRTVIQVLEKGLGLSGEGPRRNGLARFSGRWSEEELREFVDNTRVFEEIDPELWS
ncbi:MAG: hypothetical protein MI919_38925 [Holophagales bacterium]|nr:hypothetical protein [Holophagales bacterium]